ncbi:MAG: HAMP domain-containing histidine kinase [Thermoleophilia bacterium]|nr:HAMP domain-containing histidine kinase [Thermoleophilia bacterium]
MSFKRRLTLLAAGAVAIAIIAAAATAYLLVRSELRGQVDDSLRERALAARAAIELGPFGRGGVGAPSQPPPQRGGRDTPFEEGPRPDRFIPGGGPGGPEATGQLVDETGSILSARGLSGATLPVEPATAVLASGSREPAFSDATVEGTPLRVISLTVGPDTALQLARSLEEVDSALSRLALIMALIAIGGIAAATGLGLLVAGAALTPIRRLTETSEDVARTEDLTSRIEIEGDDELARLGTSFNAMLAALERSVGAQRQLVADASHELRTPITSLRTNIETLTRRPEMPGADRERLLADLNSELTELGRMVDDIVDLARDGAEASAAEPTEVRLDELVAACVDHARRRPGGDVTIETSLEPQVVVAAPERLDRAIGNLLDNALKWTPPGGTISVVVEDAAVTIIDSGPGIDAEDLPHIFDRFYRAAAARGTPGSGLGLAIVKQVAETHKGSVEAGNEPGGGARFAFHLPAGEPPADG